MLPDVVEDREVAGPAAALEFELAEEGRDLLGADHLLDLGVADQDQRLLGVGMELGHLGPEVLQFLPPDRAGGVDVSDQFPQALAV